MTRPAAVHSVALPVLLLLTALSSTTRGQTPPTPNPEPMRFTVSGGVEPHGGRTGAFVGVEVSLARAFSVGYSELNRVNRNLSPNGSSTSSITATHAVVAGYHPVRWIHAFAGPAVGSASISTRQAASSGHTHTRGRVRGGIFGATLRLHDRPFRFYFVTTNVTVLDGPEQLRRGSIAFGVGAGFKF